MNQAWRELLCVLLFFLASAVVVMELGHVEPIVVPNRSYYFTPLPVVKEP